MPRNLAIMLVAPALLCLMGEGRAGAADDVERFAQDVVIEAGQAAGDVVCFFCSVRVRGVVDGDVVTIGGGIEIEGSVTGDAVASGGGIRLGPGAKVDGDVIAIAGPLEFAAGAKVAGDKLSKPWAYVPGQRQIFLPSVVTLVGLNFGLVALAALILRRRRVEVMAKAARRRYVLIGVLGVAVLALSIVLLVLFNYNGRAQPVLASIALGALGVTALAGGAALSCCLGGTLPRVESWLRRVLAGAALLAALQMIPVVGMFVFLVLLIMTPGIAILSGCGAAEDWLPRLVRRRRELVPAAGNNTPGG